LLFDSQFTVKVQGVQALAINLISGHYIPLKFIDLMPSTQSAINPNELGNRNLGLIFQCPPNILNNLEIQFWAAK